MTYVDRAGLAVDAVVADFVETRLLDGLEIGAEAFWDGLAAILTRFTPENNRLVALRTEIQSQIDAWHRDQPAHDAAAYTAFLEEIGYLVPEGAPFEIETTATDPEFAEVAGPQLVVPVMNARYALNAANARWGSFYDALYGTDALGDLPEAGGYSPERGTQVIAKARAFLDEAAPLAEGSWADLTSLEPLPTLADPAQFLGTREAAGAKDILLRNNGLHIIVRQDPTTPVGAQDGAEISDVLLESALTAIMDCEDSVAAVDGEDKVLAWGNWLGLMRQDLTETVEKGGKSFTRALAPDLRFDGPQGPVTLKGRALLLVRNVGHLMTSPAVLFNGTEAREGLLDAVMTVTAALHDLARTDGPRNSVTGSVYVVKPKMHGPEEVALTDALFAAVEDMLALPRGTVKIGIMDEERRTTLNLRECIRAAKGRVAFINTGFLDRTGDEIHTSMEAGPVVRKGAMKAERWIAAYEDHNVDVGLACGFRGKAQIGKGMWAAPDLMGAMLDQKIGHPKAGANCAWVPSPTAATLHATHYHAVDVAAVQREIAGAGPRTTRADLLTLPLAGGHNWSEAEITEEIETNAQGILGYVVRWVDQGIGCSKVPDLSDVGLMEDRATCRISAQHMANWLRHGVIDAAQVEAVMRKMAQVVDRQNAGDPAYRPMAPGYDGPAFRAALALVLEGAEQPSGYTEPLLHKARREAKGA